jgi:endogenous inhibitor of DNA gyrase (YacG/DUF329 family)
MLTRPLLAIHQRAVDHLLVSYVESSRPAAGNEARSSLCCRVSESKKALVKCPICGKPVDYFAEPLGPFCSSRCKMIDLGRWLGEDYCVTEPLRADHFAEYEEISSQQELDRTDEEA